MNEVRSTSEMTLWLIQFQDSIVPRLRFVLGEGRQSKLTEKKKQRQVSIRRRGVSTDLKKTNAAKLEAELFSSKDEKKEKREIEMPGNFRGRKISRGDSIDDRPSSLAERANR